MIDESYYDSPKKICKTNDLSISEQNTENYDYSNFTTPMKKRKVQQIYSIETPDIKKCDYSPIIQSVPISHSLYNFNFDTPPYEKGRRDPIYQSQLTYNSFLRDDHFPDIIDTCSNLNIDLFGSSDDSVDEEPNYTNPFLCPKVDKNDISIKVDERYIQSNNTFLNHFVLYEKLGRGSYSTVYKCQSKLDGLYYAVKLYNYIERGQKKLGAQGMYVYSYICSLSNLPSGIVRYYSSIVDNSTIYIIMELCDYTLTEHIKLHPLTETDIRFLLRKMLKVLMFIHEKNIVHLDIKPDNILIRDGVYKLADWGLATIKTGELFVTEGDTRYLAFELLSENYSRLEVADIFSLGVTVYELCSNKSIAADGELWKDLRNDRIPYVDTVSKELNDIIKLMLKADPYERSTSKELYQMPYFRI